MKEIGITAIKEFPEWEGIQKTKDSWNWANADATLAEAKANDMSLYGLLLYLPAWASSSGKGRHWPMADIKDWETYAESTIGRYKDITCWEVYNEFNSPAFAKNGTPKDYAQILAATYRAAKRANPKARIGMGCADVSYSFFEQVIKEGGAGHFDFIAVHPYSVMEAVSSGREEPMLTMVKNLRALLRKTGQNENMEIVVSENGVNALATPEAEQKQASGLVKGHTLCFALGINQIYWFEGRGPAYGSGRTFGMLRKDWSPRPSYYAMKTMTGLFGKDARRIGWYNPTGKSYGFVFRGVAGPVLVMWADGAADTVALDGKVTVTKPDGTQSTAANGKIELTGDPVFITDIPQAIVEEARANASKPMPWLKDFAKSESVSVVMGASNVESGLMQVDRGDGKTTTGLVNGIHARRVEKNPYMYFDVDDSYASVGDNNLEITVTAMPVDATKGASINLLYEGSARYTETKDRFTLEKKAEWQTYTFKLSDANFGGSWGWNFRFNQAQNAWIKEVSVKRTGDKH
ncbi:MAG: endo-1,4-beta-xylanase [Candidatus Methylacidiphilales bacterium]